nr:hypothetical protein BaRGS_016810 [Batillaria attramentaria]
MFANDANNNTDLEFAKFLGEDFVKNPFVLVCKESKLPMPEMSQKQMVSMPAEDGEEPWGVVAVEMSWKGARQLLESPPSDARSSIIASVSSGSMRSSMHKFFLELDLLRRIVTALNTGEMEWVSDVSEKPATPLTTAVRNLINRLKDEGSMGSAVSQADGETDETLTFASALKGISIAERNDYDFTDQLWKVMTDCMSTAELVDSLRLVFSTLGRGELQPFVDQQNQTTVAQIVRESFTGRFSAPSLAGVQPFLFLAEIGAEKLRRDYINIFVSQRLASLSFLSPFITTESDLSTRLGLLEKMHAGLEMVALLSGTLRLTPETLGSAARQMLTHLTRHAIDPQHTFSFSLKTAEVHAILSSLRPVLWSVETHTSVGFGNVQESNLYCLCANQPFLHVASVSEESSGQGDASGVGKETGSSPEPDNQYCLVHRSETVLMM